MTETIETTILRSLLYSEDYFRKSFPHIKSEYFSDPSKRIIFEEIEKFVSNYDKTPNQEVLTIAIQSRSDLTEDSYKDLVSEIDSLSEREVEVQWAVDTTEKWCKDRAIYNAILRSIKISEGNDKELSKDAIPNLLQEALAVSFDEHIGHDFFESAVDRWNFYHTKEEKVEFDIEKLNLITDGGLSKKTLNVFMAPPGAGKSLTMCHLAASALSSGYNVLYITLEMAAERIAERIDANLLDTPIKKIKDIPQSIFTSKIEELSKKTTGKLILKEYPTASAHAGHFRALLNDLKLKKSFKPDIIYIDYLNICASSRYRGHIVNSYTYVKSISEELRGLGQEYEVPIVSATQTTRNGVNNTDVDMTDTSESFGLPQTADLMIALMTNETYEESARLQMKQIKNRYGDPTYYRRFFVGVDKSKMRLYNVDDAVDSVLDADVDDVYESLDKISNNQDKHNKYANANFDFS